MSLRDKIPAKNNPFKSANKVGIVSFTVGTEAGDAITVAVLVKDSNGRAIAERVQLDWYLSTASNGGTITASAATGGVAAGTNGSLLQTVTGKAGIGVTDATGNLDVAITDSGTPTFYLVVVMPDGTLAISGAITFA